MASWQAHVAVWIVKWRVKRRLRGSPDYLQARRVLRPTPFQVPQGVRVSSTKIGGVPCEWLEGPNPSRIILLYVHGGGYFACSAALYHAITATYALHGFRVLAPDYRLAPENKFPAAIDDVVACYHALIEEGHSARQIVLGGDSAGGGLALSLLLALRDSGVALPAGAALFSPWTDLAATGDSIQTNDRRCAMFYGRHIRLTARYYLGESDPRNPLASPLYADLKGLPPLLIHVGQDEVLRDDSTRIAGKARADGVHVELKIWPIVPHVWQLAPGLIPEARQSLRESAAFLRGLTSNAASMQKA